MRMRWIGVAALAGSAMPAIAQEAPAPAAAPASDLAARFGTRERVRDISLSPDGTKVAVVGASARGDGVTVTDLSTEKSNFLPIGAVGAMRLRECGWSAPTRLVCTFGGIDKLLGEQVGFSRTVSLDATGANVRYLGRKVSEGLRANQFDGRIIDWRGGDGQVLMMRDFVPESGVAAGVNHADGRNGMGVDLLDTVTGKARTVEQPFGVGTTYIADGLGNVRIRSRSIYDGQGLLTGETVHSYRQAGSRDWKEFTRSTPTNDVLEPVAVDGGANVTYAARKLNGRAALYRVALDGTMKEELVASNAAVDIWGTVAIGRRGRVIGATYVTDKRQVDYFDPEYRKLAAALARALPQTPLIRFVDASADESKLLLFAGSDVDPGTYYIYTKATRKLEPLVRARPELADQPLARMSAVTYKAADGTAIPGYLTLPPGNAQKGLPAIVMPHGGPSYRDEWGFDWLAQFFADAGYAVLQPNFRGSSGYGDAFFANNGFRSWQVAIGDVVDAGKWLVREGIADPAKLAIVGWSYGGYAALQANVIEPDLFKAAVAIAPVTDLDLTKREAVGFSNERLVARQIGSGASIAQGSPTRHAAKFKAPVLLFHGDKDLNVGVAQSRAMDAALKKAGRQSTFVAFPGLDHQLDDTAARSRMLRESDAFLKAAMKM